MAKRSGSSLSRITLERMNLAATESHPRKSPVRRSVERSIHPSSLSFQPSFTPRSPLTPSLPGTDSRSDRFRCGGSESKFLAAMMWPIRFLFSVGLLSLVAPCSAAIVLTLTPTARIDLETQVQIIYTLTGRASGLEGQNVGEFVFRVAPMTLPTASNIALVYNQTIAQTGPWTNPNFGTRSASIASTNSRVSFSAFGPLTGSFSTIDATGGVVGTFDIIWNRPLTGQYDAAIPASAMDGAYSLTVGGDFDFLSTNTMSSGVSTVITPVPEPGSMVLMAIASCGVLWRHRHQQRNRQ